MRDYRQDFGRLLKLGRAIFESEDSTEESEENKETKVPTKVNPILKPMPVYWDTDKQDLVNRNQHWIDLYLNDVSLQRIPDTTEEPIKESHYKLPKISWDYLPDHIKNLDPSGVTESPKPGTGISSSGRDAGMVTGIVVAVISGVLILGALIAVLVYRHYVHRNVTSMNFDNPVYRKTTEDQFALEKNGYAPGGKLYPSTVGEEAQEPLNTIGSNDFV